MITLHACMLSHVGLSDPMDCSLPGSSVHGTFQARILGWFAIPSLGDLPGAGIEPEFPVSPLLAGSLYHCAT